MQRGEGDIRVNIGYMMEGRQLKAMRPNIANMTVTRCAIVMIGLPARGKTYMAKKLTRYLNWIGIDTKEFNVGEYRRKAAVNLFTSSSEFFRPDNIEAVKIREAAAKHALEDLCDWLKSGEVAIYDATNSSRARRQMIVDYLSHESINIFFIESICNDKAIIEENIKQVKVLSPDYVMTTDKEEAIEDFKHRIQNYEKQYEGLDDLLDNDLSFIKIFNQGEKFLINNIRGHVQSRVVYYLMNIHVLPRTIYLTRHGESDFNRGGQIGGDGNLSERGRQYAGELSKYVGGLNLKNLRVWTSLLRRTVQTASGIDAPKDHWKALNELDAGVCEGLTYSEIEERFPDEFAARDKDKYHYRYPGGESYQDLVARLEPVIMELEKREVVLVVCHQAIARCLLAYFLDHSLEELPYIRVPLHTLIKLTPVAYGCQVEYKTFDIDAVDTYRPCPLILPPLTSEEKRRRRKTNSECTVPDCDCSTKRANPQYHSACNSCKQSAQ